jgi:phosphoserine phosphatase
MAKRKMSTFERLHSGKMNRKERKELQQRLGAENPGLEVVHPDAAGIDVGNASHFVAVAPDRDEQPVREFGSWTADLRRMAEWLKRCGIRTVAMQSTGVYWVAVQEILERAGLEVYLVNARGDQESAGTQERCTGIAVVDEAAHLRAIAKFVSSAGADLCGADDLAPAGPTGEGSRPGGSADAEGAYDNERAVGQHY